MILWWPAGFDRWGIADEAQGGERRAKQRRPTGRQRGYKMHIRPEDLPELKVILEAQKGVLKVKAYS